MGMGSEPALYKPFTCRSEISRQVRCELSQHTGLTIMHDELVKPGGKNGGWEWYERRHSRIVVVNFAQRRWRSAR